MCCFVILLLSNEMQMSVRRFSAIPHLRANLAHTQRITGSGMKVKARGGGYSANIWAGVCRWDSETLTLN